MMTVYQKYIFKSRYARYLPDKKRREEWPEAVDRYINFYKSNIKKGKTKIPWEEIKKAILDMKVMPSMRALMTAGPALEKDHVAGYNCCYVAIDNQSVFDEIMYILMCGTGVGFSVERQFIQKLPIVAETFHNVNTVIKVADSKIGWASALSQLLGLLYKGTIPTWDLSLIRPKGAVLKTFGGRASGPEPLNHLFKFAVNLFQKAKGRQLNSLECHDLVCKIADVVVCGGVRRSALLSLSNLSDTRMKAAKMGEWHNSDPQRALANNSVAYTETPDMNSFMDEWFNLYKSKAGERGIFNRASALASVPERRKKLQYKDYGTNPCAEIILRSKQFCNLSEVVLSPTMTDKEIKKYIKIATIIGTLQSTLTNFRYLSKEYKINCEEERLLGVSLTGITDWLGPNLGPSLALKLEEFKNVSIKTNIKYAKILGISPSSAITCVKPSGTVSQLCNSSSGIHPRYSDYYIRRVRADVKDPLCSALQKSGVPYEPSHTNPNNELVFSFPQAAPTGSITVRYLQGIEQLKLWRLFDEHWCEHKPSCTIYIRDSEWFAVGDYVYNHFSSINGVSFFPHDDHIYDQAPYEAITKEEYQKLMDNFPVTIDFNVEENIDITTASQELACTGNSCEL